MKETEYRASRICRILGNPKTYALMKELARLKKATPLILAKNLRRSIQTVSIHLRNLRNLDLVRYDKRGKNTVYWIKDRKIISVLEELEHFVERMRKKRK